MRRYSAGADRLCELLRCKYPLVAAPMAGGTTTPELAAEVAAAGCIGAVPGAYLPPQKFHENLKQAQHLADRRRGPGGTTAVTSNLFVPSAELHSIDWSLPEVHEWLEDARRSAAEVHARVQALLAMLRQGELDPANGGGLEVAVAMAFRTMSAADVEAISGEGSSSIPTVPQLLQRLQAVERTFEQCCEVALEQRPAAMSFVFGIPDESIVKEFQRRSIPLIGTATTVDEAVGLRAAGFDAVVAQGIEAGGHRGSFALPLPLRTKDGALDRSPSDGAIRNAPPFDEPPNDTNDMTTLELVSALKDEFQSRGTDSSRTVFPVIAAGGIMDADDAVGAMLRGAAGVQLGTAFLLTAEAGTSAVHAQALRSCFGALRSKTVMTRAYSGRWARGVETATTQLYHAPSSDSNIHGNDPAAPPLHTIAPFPLQGDIFGPVKTAAVAGSNAGAASPSHGAQLRMGSAQAVNAWAGTGAHRLQAYDGAAAAHVALQLATQMDDMLSATVHA